MDGYRAIFVVSYRELLRLQACDQDEAFRISEAAEDGIRSTFRNRDFHLLCAELASAIAKLKREADSDSPAMVSPSAYLDGIRPAWREELPIALEGDGARRLVDDLMNTKFKRGQRAPVSAPTGK